MMCISFILIRFSRGAKFERLTKEFFINAIRNMQPNIRVFLYYVNGRLGAFNLCFLYNDLFINKFIGFDYDISSRHRLYFVSWCHNIEWCINNGERFYTIGQADYCAKLRLGSKLLPLYAYLRHENRLVNILLKLFSLILKPDNFGFDIRGTLSKIDLSVAVPIASFSYILIPLSSALFLGESVSLFRWIGVIFIRE